MSERPRLGPHRATHGHPGPAVAAADLGIELVRHRAGVPDGADPVLADLAALAGAVDVVVVHRMPAAELRLLRGAPGAGRAGHRSAPGAGSPQGRRRGPRPVGVAPVVRRIRGRWLTAPAVAAVLGAALAGGVVGSRAQQQPSLVTTPDVSAAAEATALLQHAGGLLGQVRTDPAPVRGSLLLQVDADLTHVGSLLPAVGTPGRRAALGRRLGALRASERSAGGSGSGGPAQVPSAGAAPGPAAGISAPAVAAPGPGSHLRPASRSSTRRSAPPGRR